MRGLPSPNWFLLAIACLAGCGEVKMDSSELTARSASQQPGLDCASCHAYVLADSNHLFHLFGTTPNYDINGPITCLECHATSIQSRPTAIYDSLFMDKDSILWHALEFPVIPDSATMGDTLRRDFRLAEVDTLVRNVPVTVPARPGAAPRGGLAEWMTGLAHMNGKVDVAFDPRVSDTAKFGGKKALYSPTQESCSAIACHPSGEKEWGFPSPSKRLPMRKH
jgi:hypothetical protein